MFKTTLSVIGGVVVGGIAAAVGYYFYKETADGKGEGEKVVVDVLEKIIDFVQDKSEATAD